MTARKSAAPKSAPRKPAAKKAAPRKRPSPLGVSATPPAPQTPEDRIAALEENVAQLRAEVGQITQIIQQAIVAQLQQAVATDPAAQKALLAHFQEAASAAVNGASK